MPPPRPGHRRPIAAIPGCPGCHSCPPRRASPSRRPEHGFKVPANRKRRPAVALLFRAPPGQRLIIVGLFGALGFFVYGLQMLVAVAAADFATKVASASAVGLTGLLGYLGATVSGLATGLLVDAYGWNGAIWFYRLSALVGCALLALTWSQTAAAASRDGLRT